MASGKYVKVYLTQVEATALVHWQLSQSRDGNNQSESHALKTGFQKMMLEMGFLELQEGPIRPVLRAVDPVQKKAEKEAEERSRGESVDEVPRRRVRRARLR